MTARVADTPKPCGPFQTTSCSIIDYLAIKSPTGIDSLDGSQYGGLKAVDVFGNALNNWLNAGKSNTRVTSKVSNTAAITQLEKTNLQHVPGLVSIPVCSLKEAGNVIWTDENNDNKNPYWPCPEGPSG